jgi:hypothetical protein
VWWSLGLAELVPHLENVLRDTVRVKLEGVTTADFVKGIGCVYEGVASSVIDSEQCRLFEVDKLDDRLRRCTENVGEGDWVTVIVGDVDVSNESDMLSLLDPSFV